MATITVTATGTPDTAEIPGSPTVLGTAASDAAIKTLAARPGWTVSANALGGSVSGTLVAGEKDLALTNAVGDRLAVLVTTPGGTPGVLSVKRKSGSEVTVQSWLAATGIEVADVSVVAVYNFGA